MALALALAFVEKTPLFDFGESRIYSLSPFLFLSQVTVITYASFTHPRENTENREEWKWKEEGEKWLFRLFNSPAPTISPPTSPLLKGSPFLLSLSLSPSSHFPCSLRRRLTCLHLLCRLVREAHAKGANIVLIQVSFLAL